MAIEFNHRREILAIRDGFPQYYKAKVPVKIAWEADFAENDFRSAYKTGRGKDEKSILSTKILVESKDISVTFIEDVEGALTININRRMVYTIKPKGRISQKLLDAFTCAIIKEQL